MRQTDVFSVITERVNVGLSAVIGITGGPNVVSVTLEYLTGGTCELMGASTQAAGTGYLLGSGRDLTLGGPATVFLLSAGATSTVMVLKSLNATLESNL